MEKKKVKLGRLDPKRDLTHVEDTVDGFIRAGEAKDIDGNIIQLGTGSAISIGDLFTVACKVFGCRAEVKQEVDRLRPPDSEIFVLQSDPAKAKSLLGWVPKIGIEEGIRRTGLWIKRHLNLFFSESYQK